MATNFFIITEIAACPDLSVAGGLTVVQTGKKLPALVPTTGDEDGFANIASYIKTVGDVTTNSTDFAVANGNLEAKRCMLMYDEGKTQDCIIYSQGANWDRNGRKVVGNVLKHDENSEDRDTGFCRQDTKDYQKYSSDWED